MAERIIGHQGEDIKHDEDPFEINPTSSLGATDISSLLSDVDGVLDISRSDDPAQGEANGLSKRAQRRANRLSTQHSILSGHGSTTYGNGKYGKQNAEAARKREEIDAEIEKYNEGYRNGRKSYKSKRSKK